MRTEKLTIELELAAERGAAAKGHQGGGGGEEQGRGGRTKGPKNSAPQCF